MKLIRVIAFLRRHLRTVVKVSLLALVLLVVADALPFVVDKTHAHTAPERVPGFWAVFGFLACVVIIVVSKALGHGGLMVREDHYDE